MRLKNLKDLSARVYFYAKLGWTNYIARWLGLAYKNQIMQFNLQIEICRALGINAKELEIYLPRLKEHKKKYIKFLKRSKMGK